MTLLYSLLRLVPTHISAVVTTTRARVHQFTVHRLHYRCIAGMSRIRLQRSGESRTFGGAPGTVIGLAAACILCIAGLYLRPWAPDSRALFGSTHAPQHDQFVVITDNPFLIPNLPKRRKDELSRSVRMNLESPDVSSLHLLNEAPNNQTLYPGGKLTVYDLGWRSTFLDAIRYANAMLPPNTMFVVSNADIVFAHESVRLIARIKDPDVVVALSRHEVHEDGHATLHEDPSLSQDAWFMRTPFPEHPGFDFPMGTLGSDNKLAYLYSQTLNKTVVNWCNDVVIWHYHSSQHRGEKARLPQPYAKVPNTRVNVSMLVTSWTVKRISVPSGGRSTYVEAISLDLPQLTEAPLTSSHVGSRANPPATAIAVVGKMLAIAKRRIAQRDHRSAGMSRQGIHYLDIPWLLLSPGQVMFRDDVLLRRLKSAIPSLALQRTFALVPEEIVPALCHGSREWREMIIGSKDARGFLLGEVVCPPTGES